MRPFIRREPRRCSRCGQPPTRRLVLRIGITSSGRYVGQRYDRATEADSRRNVVER